MPLGYAPPEPRIPLLGPRRVLPVDRAMVAALFLLVASTCIAGGMSPGRESLWSATFLVTVWGTGYLLLRILNAPGVAPLLRAQLVAAAVLCVAATVVATWIYFDWPYQKGRTVVRPHPRSLYVAAAVAALATAWFATVKCWVRHAARNGESPQSRD
jgi:hypothetical protein